MLEIVFSDSALGSLKIAKRLDSERSIVGFGIIGAADGPPARGITHQEVGDFLRKAQLQWEKATPMGGTPQDAYGFNLVLSIGDISENLMGEKRLKTLDWLYSIYPELDDEPPFTVNMIKQAEKTMAEIASRISAGEAVRIWYSNQPDELCGLYWFMAQIHLLNLRNDQVFLVKLPDWETRPDGAIATYSSWNEIDAIDWQRFQHLQQPAPLTFCKTAAFHWQDLQRENAPLRAMLNGRLASVPESLYDIFIHREIYAESDEFHEAEIIGRVLGNYGLGIGDAWVAHRIEGMISAGMLAPVTKADPNSPIYHRRLKKCMDT